MLYVMTSKLDPLFEQVFEQLNDRGLSYRSVCDQLLLHQGLKISPQALRSWHLRRSRKISERAGSRPGVSPRIQNTETLAVRTPNAEKASRPATPRLSIGRATESDQVAVLQGTIERQQQNLANNPFSLGNTNFLVQRKR